MKTKCVDSIARSEITPKSLFYSRRHFMQTTGGAALAALMAQPLKAGEKLSGAKPSAFNTDEELTPYKDVTTYNNFYEYGTDKEDPFKNAGRLQTKPWTLTVDGEVHKPKTFAIEELLSLAPLEERIYRLRCVEAWSMVIPWLGYSLAEIINRVEPTEKAHFVEFTSLHDPMQMPGQRSSVLAWPYTEGLRLDEAMHPLTLLTLGLYGEVLPKQNGAPVRIVVPWKYGFKSPKSIVRIRFVQEQPTSSWMQAGPSEYGFYSNVNPTVDHARWSQAKERRIGEFFKRKTLMFNGYEQHVASMYSDMDLQKYF